ncbi:hypothetical protein C8J37_12317 [Rhizobium sp. PP-WC-1G-195]|nr:hypothetical protein C8J37_12317 [Rhizobium sp. PP-WC-1G-195]
MKPIPKAWQDYARLQDELANSPMNGARANAIEATMNKILESGNSLTAAEIDIATESAARNDRNRKALRAEFFDLQEMVCDPVRALEARSFFAKIRAQAPAAEWAVLVSIGIGESQQEMAACYDIAPSAAGVRAFRARQALKLRLDQTFTTALHEFLAA